VTPAQVVDQLASLIAERENESSHQKPMALWLDPRRILPTERITVLRGLDESAMEKLGSIAHLVRNPIDVAFANGMFFAVDGHKRLSSAITRHAPWVPCQLIGESDELVGSGMTAFDAWRALTREPSRVYDWEDAHQLNLPLPD
jgi:hypothetical protein